ncbi:Hypothetical predicted protein [Lecanosticta acicola]|uniref:Uncharacterized protein n=1 Tax=Lecanosticta acicola TaxID=111012 RepID=A0AAI8YVE1_9PEZI|nr:Hypothetical predicted protein [Lecanosticta acicola]
MISTWRERSWSRSAVVNGGEEIPSVAQGVDVKNDYRVDSLQVEGETQAPSDSLAWLNLDAGASSASASAHSRPIGQPAMPRRPPPPPPINTNVGGAECSSKSGTSIDSGVDPRWARNHRRRSIFVEHLPENRWRLEKKVEPRRRIGTSGWFSSLRKRY